MIRCCVNIFEQRLKKNCTFFICRRQYIVKKKNLESCDSLIVMKVFKLNHDNKTDARAHQIRRRGLPIAYVKSYCILNSIKCVILPRLRKITQTYHE